MIKAIIRPSAAGYKSPFKSERYRGTWRNDGQEPFRRVTKVVSLVIFAPLTGLGFVPLREEPVMLDQGMGLAAGLGLVHQAVGGVDQGFQ